MAYLIDAYAPVDFKVGIGNSTDCSAASPGKQVRSQNVHITGPLLGESTNHQQLVFPQTKEQ